MDVLDAATTDIDPEKLKAAARCIVLGCGFCPGVCPVIDCGVPLWCRCGYQIVGPPIQLDFLKVITDDLAACGDGFYQGCSKFGEIVGPVCPRFDPVERIKDWRIRVRLDELQAKVKELETKLAKSR